MEIKYQSTRSEGMEVTASQAIFKGLGRGWRSVCTKSNTEIGFAVNKDCGAFLSGDGI